MRTFEGLGKEWHFGGVQGPEGQTAEAEMTYNQTCTGKTECESVGENTFSVVPLRLCRKFCTAAENNLPLLNAWTDESTKLNEI